MAGLREAPLRGAMKFIAAASVITTVSMFIQPFVELAVVPFEITYIT